VWRPGLSPSRFDPLRWGKERERVCGLRSSCLASSRCSNGPGPGVLQGLGVSASATMDLGTESCIQMPLGGWKTKIVPRPRVTGSGRFPQSKPAKPSCRLPSRHSPRLGQGGPFLTPTLGLCGPFPSTHQLTTGKWWSRTKTGSPWDPRCHKPLQNTPNINLLCIAVGKGAVSLGPSSWQTDRAWLQGHGWGLLHC